MVQILIAVAIQIKNFLISFFKDILIPFLVFISRFTVLFTGDNRYIDRDNLINIPKQIIFIIWGLVGFIMLIFILYLSYNLFIIEKLLFIERRLVVKTTFIIVFAIILFNIYFFSIKTLHYVFNGSNYWSRPLIIGL